MDVHELLDLVGERGAAWSDRESRTVESSEGSKFALYGPVINGRYSKEALAFTGDFLEQSENDNDGLVDENVLNNMALHELVLTEVSVLLEDVWFWERV